MGLFSRIVLNLVLNPCVHLHPRIARFGDGGSLNTKPSVPTWNPRAVGLGPARKEYCHTAQRPAKLSSAEKGSVPAKP